ncbi:MAG: hypothetical protein J2P17_24800 [Mycobacterium sp.]|nr:hypothetical protein [Mycobacterium sp.]
MTASSESIRAIVGAIAGLFYGSILALLSLLLFGSGHATSIPLLLSSAPLGVVGVAGKLVGEPYVGYGYKAMLFGTPLLWAALGSLVALSGSGRSIRRTQILVLLHYASGLALVAAMGEGPAHLNALPGIWMEIAMWAMVYLAGQVALWSSTGAISGARRGIISSVVGLLYGSTLVFLSIGAAGGGHGTPIPLLLSSAPLSFVYLVAASVPGPEYSMLLGGPLVWAALGWLVARPDRRASLSLARNLVLLHYVSGLALIATTGAGVRGLAGEVPDLFIVWALFYLAGQVVLWWRLTRRSQLRPTD